MYFDNSYWVEILCAKIHNVIMQKKYLKCIGKNIKNIRRSKKISQEKLAELIGKSRNYVGMVERAELNIPAGMLINIALALKTHPKEFFDMDL